MQDVVTMSGMQAADQQMLSFALFTVYDINRGNVTVIHLTFSSSLANINEDTQKYATYIRQQSQSLYFFNSDLFNFYL